MLPLQERCCKSPTHTHTDRLTHTRTTHTHTHKHLRRAGRRDQTVTQTCLGSLGLAYIEFSCNGFMCWAKSKVEPPWTACYRVRRSACPSRTPSKSPDGISHPPSADCV